MQRFRPLNEVAEIRGGVIPARKKAKPYEEAIYTYKLLTLKALGENGKIDKTYLEEIRTVKPLESIYLTQKGDTIIRMSEPNTAIFIEEDNIAIPALFMRIRPFSEEILPQYLTIYLNTEQVRNQFKVMREGSSLKTIKSNVLANCPVKILSKKQQLKLIELYKIHQEEVALFEQLKNLKEQMYFCNQNKLLVGEEL